MAENMDDIMRAPQGGSGAAIVPNPNFDHSAVIKQMTGLNIDPSTLPSTQQAVAEQQQEKPARAKYTHEDSMEGFKPVPRPMDALAGVDLSDPSIIQKMGVGGSRAIVPPEPTGEVSILSGDEAAQLGSGRRVDVEEELFEANDRRVEQAQSGKSDAFMRSLEGLIVDEEARLDSAIEVTSDPEKYKEKIRPADDETGASNDADVAYAVTTERRIGDDKDVEFNPMAKTDADADVDDLVPSYDYEEEEEPKVEEKAPPTPGEAAEYSRYIRGLEIATTPYDKSVVSTVKDRQIDIVPSSRNKSGRFLNDGAFLNSITKFKKDNFSTVAVPLVNSGFIADIVGTGVVDLIQLYTKVSEDTTQMDYEIEKMRTVMRNVVGTHPRIDPNKLRDLIHYSDYEMMAYGHICATLDTIESVANCLECGKPFRINASPRALLLNMDELISKMEEIKAADSIEQHSLLTTNRKLVSKGLFEITIGHPSYGEFIRMMSQVKSYAENMQQLEATRFLGEAMNLYYIRQIKLPNNVIASNIYQIYLATTLLSDADYAMITDEIKLMQKDVLTPKFGIAKVTCPHCGKIITDVPYSSLTDLVFFHSQVSQMLLATADENPGKE